jgi:hypothetical protein
MHEHIRQELRRADRTLLIVFLAVSLPFLLGAGYMSYRSLWFTFGAEHSQGRVVAIRSGVPQLRVEYRTASGQQRTIESAGSDLYKNYRVGDAVTVHYDREQPSTVRLDLFVEMWLFPTLLGVFGGFFFLPVILMGGLTEVRQWFRRGHLDRDGVVVQADYRGYELTLGSAATRMKAGDIRTLSLRNDNGHYTLLHNGLQRDPLDPLVQRELGLRFIVRARWRDPQTGREYAFESGPEAENPERHVRNGRIAIRMDPKNPGTYRFEAYASAAQARRSSAIE